MCTWIYLYLPPSIGEQVITNITMNTTLDADTFEKCFVFQATNEIVSKSPSEKFVINRIVLCVVSGLLIIPTILLNGISVVTILKSSQLKRKVCYFPILLQSIADFIVGLFSYPLYIILLSGELTGTINCTVSLLIGRSMTLPTTFSFAFLSAMNIERYLAILYPYAYVKLVTKRRILIYVLAHGLTGITWLLLSFFYNILYALGACTFFILFLLVTTIIYVRIFLVIRRLQRSEHESSVSAGQNDPSKHSKKRKILKEIKQVRSTFNVVICFCLSLLPSSVILLTINNRNYEHRIYKGWSVLLISINSCMNSVIFFWIKTLLRNEAKKVIKTFFGK